MRKQKMNAFQAEQRKKLKSDLEEWWKFFKIIENSNSESKIFMILMSFDKLIVPMN